MNRRTDFGFLLMVGFAICVSSGQSAVAQAPSSSDDAEAVAPIQGDYNSNGLVEQGDLDLVLGHWGALFDADTMPTWTNDPPIGIIDQAELDKVLGNWGKSAGGTIPEPSSLWLLALGAAGGFALWRRCRARA